MLRFVYNSSVWHGEDPRMVRHKMWRLQSYLRHIMEQYYLLKRQLVAMYGSGRGRGLHAGGWFKNEVAQFKTPLSTLEALEATISFDDMIPACFHTGHVVIEGVTKAVNTGAHSPRRSPPILHPPPKPLHLTPPPSLGTLNQYLRERLQKVMKKEGHLDSFVNKGWKKYDRHRTNITPPPSHTPL